MRFLSGFMDGLLSCCDLCKAEGLRAFIWTRGMSTLVTRKSSEILGGSQAPFKTR